MHTPALHAMPTTGNANVDAAATGSDPPVFSATAAADDDYDGGDTGGGSGCAADGGARWRLAWAALWGRAVGGNRTPHTTLNAVRHQTITWAVFTLPS